MLETLSSAEYSEVLAAFERWPLPDTRADLRAAMLALVIARSQGAKGCKLADFVPQWDRPADQAEQTPEEMSRHMAALSALMKGPNGR